MKFDKNKVYTAANADSLRTGSMGYHADNLEALKRRVSSEVNEEYGMLTEILDEGCSYRFRINDIMDNALFYLVEEPQKKKFRPYNDINEMIDHFNERFDLIPQKYRLPTMWIKHKDSGCKYLITGCADDHILAYPYTIKFEVLLENFTYLDGSPCGIEED